MQLSEPLVAAGEAFDGPVVARFSRSSPVFGDRVRSGCSSFGKFSAFSTHVVD
jgi:hypothetical protein